MVDIASQSTADLGADPLRTSGQERTWRATGPAS